MEKLKGFVAYPNYAFAIKEVITESIKEVNNYNGIDLHPWEENEISGRPLIHPIFSNIETSDLLVADITTVNFNVTYEIGYAIGMGKRVHLIRNKEYNSKNNEINLIGIFDTLGYTSYSNSKELSKILNSVNKDSPINIAKPINRETPVYILEPPIKGETTLHIVSRVKKARLQYRSFTPSEESRLSGVDAIAHVASSCGIIIPLLNEDVVDANIHNIRAAFVAGLARGMSKPNLLIQNTNGPIPLDVRDFVETFENKAGIERHIHSFALDVTEEIQNTRDIEIPEGNFMSKLSLGDPMAENEFQTLGGYYVQTDEYQRALRGEVNLVVGRKGTGKTALSARF